MSLYFSKKLKAYKSLTLASTLCACLLSLLFASIAYAAPAVTSSIEPEQGTVHDVFLLEVKVTGIPDSRLSRPEFRPSHLFKIEPAGTSSSLQIINGRSSQSLSYSFSVHPNSGLKPGVYPLPRGTIEINGKIVELNKLSIKIIHPGSEIEDSTSAGGKNVNFVHHVDLLNPYVGQQVTYKAEIAATENMVKGTLGKIDLSGFWREPIRDGKPSQRRRGDILIQSISEVLIPSKSGRHIIPERTLEAKIRSEQQGRRSLRRSRDLFSDPFFNSWPFSEQRLTSKRYIAKPIELNVRPLPPAPPTEQNYVPVGKLNILSKLSAESLTQGESLTMNVKISGDGNLRPLDLPIGELEKNDAFKIYVDKPKLSTSVRGSKIRYSKVFKVALVALQAGKHQIPSIKLLTFNPDEEKYVYLETPEKVIEVRASSEKDELVLSGNQLAAEDSKPQDHKREIEILSQDILPQHLGRQTLDGRKTWSLFSLLCILLLLPSFSLFIRKFIKSWYVSLYQPEVFSQKNAFPNARSRLSAETTAENPIDKDSLDLVNLKKTLNTYLSEKFILNADSLTAKELLTELRPRLNDESILLEIDSLLNDLERTLYSGSHLVSREDYTHYRDRTKGVIEGIERSIKPNKGKFKSLFSVILALLSVSCSTEQQGGFGQYISRGNASYEAGDFEQAASDYQKAIDAGANNPHLYYNLGNAQFRQKKWGYAIASYRKALRDLPRDPDLNNNLTLARRKALDSLSSEQNMLRQLTSRVLFIKTQLSDYELASLLVTCSFIFWLAFALQPLLKSKSNYAYLLITSGGLALIFFVLLLFVRINARGEAEFSFEFNYNSLGIGVISSEVVNVHSGDSDNFQVIFVLHEGAEVDLGRSRKDWVQIFLPGGRTGWVKESDLIKI